MKFIVSSSLLLKNIQILGGILNTNNTLPILDYFLFEISKNLLKITASDLETTLIADVKVDSDKEGTIAVPAKLLIDTLKTFPEQPLTFNVLENNTIEISSNHGKYALAYAKGDEFPKTLAITDASNSVISSKVLYQAINTTIFASGNDDLRPIMSGVFFQFSSENSTFVATDAHKLVRYVRTDYTSDKLVEFIMPKKPLNILKGILINDDFDVNIEFNESNAKFIFSNLALTCRLIDGKYPNYEAVIPKENPNVLTIDRALFLNSTKRVSIFSNKTTHQIRLKITGNELIISAEDLDYSNKAEERLSCNYNGDDIQIGFNSRFLVEMLSNIGSDEVKLELSLPNRAGILTPTKTDTDSEQITMLVMPVMLNS
jgi:DNA polymerase-3 subunit beta|tara:strand:+ start:3124 stop:4242 length:1119 start_codon:yes stop_codon:yes gene_type:complete